MGPIRHAFLPHILLLVVLLAPVHTAGAGTIGEGVVVTMSGPSEVVLEGGEGTEFQLHVSSRIECRSGFAPPRDLVMFPARAASDRGDGSLWRITPESVRLQWDPAADQKDAYVLDTIVTFNVTSEQMPVAPVASDAVMLMEELDDDDPRLHCRVDEYQLELEEHEFSFLVVPDEDPELSTTTTDSDPPVRWFPMFLAIGILAAMAAFATVRERQRRRSS